MTTSRSPSWRGLVGSRVISVEPSLCFTATTFTWYFRRTSSSARLFPAMLWLRFTSIRQMLSDSSTKSRMLV